MGKSKISNEYEFSRRDFRIIAYKKENVKNGI